MTTSTTHSRNVAGMALQGLAIFSQKNTGLTSATLKYICVRAGMSPIQTSLYGRCWVPGETTQAWAREVIRIKPKYRQMTPEARAKAKLRRLELKRAQMRATP